MRVIYTIHANDQIKERKLIKEWVEEIIKHPDIIECYKNKYYVSKKLNHLNLKVIYIKEKYIKVITVYPI